MTNHLRQALALLDTPARRGLAASVAHRHNDPTNPVSTIWSAVAAEIASLEQDERDLLAQLEDDQ